MTSAFDTAVLLLEANRARDAVAAAREAVRADPEDALAHSVLARALLEAGQVDAALAAAQRTCALGPELYVGHGVRATCHIERGEPWLALPAAREAARLAPDLLYPAVVLTEAALAAGDGALAWSAARHALAVDPASPDAHFAIGRVAAATGDHRTAQAAYRHVLALRPDDAGALNNLAMLQRGEERTTMLVRSLRLDPGSRVSLRNVERVGWGWLGAWAGVTWFGTMNIARVVGETSYPVAADVALLALVPVCTTAAAVRYVRRLPPEVRRHVGGQVRRALPRRRTVLALLALAAVFAALFAVPDSRPYAGPLLFDTLVVLGVVAFVRRKRRLRAAAGPPRLVVGEVAPESFAPLRSRVLAVVADVVVGSLFCMVGVSVAVALVVLARQAAEGWWFAAAALAGNTTGALGYVVVGETRGGTFGQSFARIAVVTTSGDRPSPRQVLARAGWWLVSWLTFGLAWRDVVGGGRSLADRRTGTAVIRRGAALGA